MFVITTGVINVNGNEVSYEVLRDKDGSTVVEVTAFGSYRFDPNTESTVLELYGTAENLFEDGDRELMWSIFHAKEKFTLEGLYKQAAELIVWGYEENEEELSA